MNSFEKMKIFKKFFPHNNFDKIMHVQNIKNKLKKIEKINAQLNKKERRLNIL